MDELENRRNGRIPGLENIRKKWFNGNDKNNKYRNSKMDTVFGNNQHKVWDAVRGLTRIIFNKNSPAKLRYLDQDAVEEVADRICELIYLLGSEAAKMEKERTEKKEVGGNGATI